MSFKFISTVLVIGALMFFLGRSFPLVKETLLSQPHLAKEISLIGSVPFGENGTAANEALVSPAGAEKVLTDCSFATAGKPSQKNIVFNEVAWMGNTESAMNEWIELKNICESSTENCELPTDISGWQISDKDGGLNFVFPPGTMLAAQSFYLLARKAEAVPVKADAVYSGNLKNTDEGLRLFDSQCDLQDEVLANPNWPAGENNKKHTMERANDLTWHTSAAAGGTPGAENSTPKSALIQKESAVSVEAALIPAVASSSASSAIGDRDSSSAPAVAIQNSGQNKILFSEIMAGMDGNASYEFIEFYNAGQSPVDLTGWKITKKTSSGSESTLVAMSRLEGKIIPAQKHFLLANQSGYNGPVPADVFWPASYTLAYTNNAVVLYNAQGAKIEEVSWSEIPKNQSFNRISWENNQFTAQSQPTPQNSSY